MILSPRSRGISVVLLDGGLVEDQVLWGEGKSQIREPIANESVFCWAKRPYRRDRRRPIWVSARQRGVRVLLADVKDGRSFVNVPVG